MAEIEPIDELNLPGITPDQKKVYELWQSNIKRAKKAQPAAYWERARNRYKAECEDPASDDIRPFVNDLRKQHESSMAFLDQQEPSFKVSPADGWTGDPMFTKMAECDAAYLKYVWREQKCQKAESRKLNSAVLVNNGDTLIRFDVKKWMPTLEFVQPDNILIDPDCNGIIEKAGWVGYFEDIPPEEFRSWHKDMPEIQYKEILKKAGSVLEKKDQPDDAETANSFKAVRIYHIFAKDSYAVRKEKEGGDDEVLNKLLAEQLQLDTPRKYLQFVDGWQAAVIDQPQWQFDLDHDEFPITHLQFNQDNDSIYGFTDYQQMSRLEEEKDEVIKNIGVACFWASIQKFIGKDTEMISPENLNDWLNKAETAYLGGMVDSEGKPKLLSVQRGQIDLAMMEGYKLLHDQSKEASSMNELMANADIQAMKDVTAIGIRTADSNMHQRVNRRLGGPWGYEQSITEDAIKMLEVAHQFVPKLSSVSRGMKDFPLTDQMTGAPQIDPLTNMPMTEQKEDIQDLPWPEAMQAISEGGTLLKLGVDAIVGQELAQFWSFEVPPQQWRLSTKVAVEPGTTRSITKEQQTAVMKQLYVEVFQPFYEATGRLDLCREFLEMIGRLSGLPGVDLLLPKGEELKGQLLELQQVKQQFQEFQQQVAVEKMQQAGKDVQTQITVAQAKADSKENKSTGESS
ncbi:MAG: hypothetical protein WC441_04915 [Patescibacteria group bacterium]